MTYQVPNLFSETEESFQPALHSHDVCGVDEVGRGPLAGPVVAAAVILPAGHGISGIADSKAISAKQRDVLFELIMTCAEIGIGFAQVEEIDDLNIHHASLLAMQRAVFRLGRSPALALVDGRHCPDLPCESRAIIKGDAKIEAIGAASIIAKVTRDRLMADLHADHPAYGWERNAGYGTREHLAALEIWGATAHHRRSFAPVRAVARAGAAGGAG